MRRAGADGLARPKDALTFAVAHNRGRCFMKLYDELTKQLQSRAGDHRQGEKDDASTEDDFVCGRQ
jgi:hypothetical protein